MAVSCFQLASQCACLGVVLYTLMSVVSTTRSILGSIESDLVFYFWNVVNHLRNFDGSLYLMEYFGIKYYTLVVKKRMLHVNDDFMSAFFFLANKAAALISTMSVVFSQQGFEEQAEMMGQSQFPVPQMTPVGSW